ncbi:helix-turn-helix domain-containing protein [Dyadobacter subterraneus]|uniref:Helix-turn-helix domain-containing protein n=1 Tax=Dyadobacter subterraneus TaxID=2773304 RepID=A0ABR9W8Z2_9BACT|nr:helix-turn-helix domain-containing protein [Dyadobacter subterraneus]MBE9461954.1 helix-turn-helix domain-containing protein [Dyadobacter subterraneus]
MEHITFDQLPAVVAEIRDRLARIESSLNLINPINPSEVKNPLMTITEASDFLNLAKSTIYGMVCRNEIPVSKKGKKLYFDREELTYWVKKGRRKTTDEIQLEAEGYLNKFSKRRW